MDIPADLHYTMWRGIKECMNIVQPIRDKEAIQEIKEFFKEQNERNYILFLLGINTGLRISYVDLKESCTIYKTVVIIWKKFNRFRGGFGKNKPITRSMAYVILTQAAKEFGLERIGTHSLRKTYGYHHYKQFKDVVVLQTMLNHTDQKEALSYIGIEQDTLNDYQKKFKI